MARNILHLTDENRIAINNRLAKTVRWLGEHSLNREMLIELYGDDNPLLAFLDDDPAHEMSLIEAVSIGVFNRAMKGDIRAIEFIRDTIGEKPATNLNVTASDKTTGLANLTNAQIEQLLSMNGKDKVEVRDAEIIETSDSPFEEEDEE